MSKQARQLAERLLAAAILLAGLIVIVYFLVTSTDAHSSWIAPVVGLGALAFVTAAAKAVMDSIVQDRREARQRTIEKWRADGDPLYTRYADWPDKAESDKSQQRPPDGA
jgi:hypothetical protein